jgi:DNA-binding NarL/FixJ family response regulator
MLSMMIGVRRAGSAFDLLTAREREIVERAMLGSHNKEIAYDLGLSDSTIRVLVSRAAYKLGVRTRRELLAKLKNELAARF